MILHTFTNILVNKFFGNNLVNRFSYVSLTISYSVVRLIYTVNSLAFMIAYSKYEICFFYYILNDTYLVLFV